jgi:murein DD-endopeptidase MepM/ murein hydrolase activator NlpD
MYESVAFPLAKKLAKLTTILLLAGVAAGCSNELTRFSEGPFSNPFPSGADPITTGSVPAPQRIRSASNDAPLVSASPIRPLRPEVAASPLVRRTASADMLPPPPSAPQLSPSPPAMRDVDPIVTGSTAPAASGAVQAVTSYQGWTKKGGIPFTLGQDDTVTSVAERFGIPVAALLAVNGLSSPADAVPGTKLILPVLSSAAASPAGPVVQPSQRKVADASVSDAQPQFLFQSGAPFSARAAQIPFEARSDVTLANADESEAAILRKKLKKLQEEVDALEASETKKKSASKPKIQETASSVVERPATQKKKAETARASDDEAVAKPKAKKIAAESVASTSDAKPKTIKAPVKTEASSEKLAAAPEAKKIKPKANAADESSTLSQSNERKVAAAKPAKTVAVKQVASKDAVPKAKPAKDSAKPKAIAKAETTASAKPKAEKLASAEKATSKKPKAEQLAKAEPKVKAKPARVVEAAPEKTAASADANQAAEAPSAPVSADDAIVTAKVDPAPVAVDPGFRWPARGRVIQGFDGTGNRGVKIAMPEGTPVKSAGAGKVIYVGEDVKGYGKLVLVRHVDGYVSAYGNNSELLVKRGEEVGRGQELARSGATGDVSSPMLHFELRKGAQAVDPMAYLK